MPGPKLSASRSALWAGAARGASPPTLHSQRMADVSFVARISHFHYGPRSGTKVTDGRQIDKYIGALCILRQGGETKTARRARGPCERPAQRSATCADRTTNGGEHTMGHEPNYTIAPVSGGNSLVKFFRGATAFRCVSDCVGNPTPMGRGVFVFSRPFLVPVPSIPLRLRQARLPVPPSCNPPYVHGNPGASCSTYPTATAPPWHGQGQRPSARAISPGTGPSRSIGLPAMPWNWAEEGPCCLAHAGRALGPLRWLHRRAPAGI